MDHKYLISLTALAGLGMTMATSTAPAFAQPLTTQASCVDGTGPNSAFYCAPRAQGNPIRACTTSGLSGTRLATCRKTTADSFCRTVAFTSSAAFSVNTSGALAEVTCTGRQAVPTSTPRPQTGTQPSTSRPPQTASNVTPNPPANAPVAAEPIVQQDYVYATSHTNADGSVTFKPTLQVSAFGPDMTGFTTITNPRSDFDAAYQSGGGTYTASRYTGTFANNVFAGTWSENENEQGLFFVQRTCDPPSARGELVWGYFEIRFTPDRRSFIGTKTTCDRVISQASDWDKNAWKGTLTGRAEASVGASAAAPTGPTPTFANPSSSSQTRASSTPTTQPVSTQPSATRAQQATQRDETVADRIAREAADAAEQRAKEEARRGVNSAIDGLLKRRP